MERYATLFNMMIFAFSLMWKCFYSPMLVTFVILVLIHFVLLDWLDSTSFNSSFSYMSILFRVFSLVFVFVLCLGTTKDLILGGVMSIKYTHYIPSLLVVFS